jgi:stress-induced morphogen
MIRHIPLQPIGKDRMTAKIPDEAFEPGDVIHVHITPQRKAASHFEIEVPGVAK